MCVCASQVSAWQGVLAPSPGRHLWRWQPIVTILPTPYLVQRSGRVCSALGLLRVQGLRRQPNDSVAPLQQVCVAAGLPHPGCREPVAIPKPSQFCSSVAGSALTSQHALHQPCSLSPPHTHPAAVDLPPQSLEAHIRVATLHRPVETLSIPMPVCCCAAAVLISGRAFLVLCATCFRVCFRCSQAPPSPCFL